MSYGSNTYSNISTFVNTIYEDAFAVAREQNLAAGLVSVFNDKSGMAARKSQGYSAVTINSIGETDDLSSQVFTPSAVATLTPVEYGAQFLLTDQRLESDPFGARADAAYELGAAMAAKMDTALFGAYLSSLTGGTVGATGSAISWTYFENGIALLRAQMAPLPYVAVMHPYQWTILARAASVAGASAYNAVGLSDEINRNFWVNRVLGVDIYISSNVEVSGTDAYLGIFSRPALALDMRRAPRLEAERDASRRAWELNMSAVFAPGVWRPKFGVQGIFALTTPS